MIQKTGGILANGQTATPKRPENYPRKIQKRLENDPKTQLALDIKLPENNVKLMTRGFFLFFSCLLNNPL